MVILQRILGIFFLLLAAYMFMSGGYSLTNIILRPLLAILGVFLFIKSFKKKEVGNESQAKINPGFPFLLMIIGFTIPPIAFTFLFSIFKMDQQLGFAFMYLAAFWTFSFLLAFVIIGLARVLRRKK